MIFYTNETSQDYLRNDFLKDILFLMTILFRFKFFFIDLNFKHLLIFGKLSNISIQFERRDALNPERGTLDISKAKSLLAYSPVYDLSKGLEKYIEWYKATWFSDIYSEQNAESNE